MSRIFAASYVTASDLSLLRTIPATAAKRPLIVPAFAIVDCVPYAGSYPAAGRSVSVPATLPVPAMIS